MSRWISVVGSVGLFVFLIFGIDEIALTAETKKSTHAVRCEAVDEQLEKELEPILEILIEEDVDRLTERVNELAATDLLEDEKNRIESADCLAEVYENHTFYVKVNGYHSLLTFATQMKEKEDVQFEEITFSTDGDSLLQIEGVLKDTDEKVFIDHDLPIFLADDYSTKEEQNEAEEKPFMLAITEGVASSAQAFLQNPIEGFMQFVDGFFTEEADEEQQRLIDKSINAARVFTFNFSVIRFGADKWEPLTMVEYYPSNTSYAIFDRAAQVHEELPDYWYPKEEIERGDWNEVVAYYNKHETEMMDFDYDLYMYIVDYDYKPDDFEEIIEKVKEHHPDGNAAGGSR